MLKNTKISIITVCRNEVDHISFTIDSVLRQNPDLYEFLILDGNSNDGTLEIIRAYEKKFIEKNIDYKIVSESDTGIYNAMNKGIFLAKNPYCIFMNGGDGFYNDSAIEDAVTRINATDPDVLYGDSLRFDEENGTFDKYTSRHTDLLWNCTIAHQSSFIKTKFLKTRNYNESFKCAADYEYWLYLLSVNAKFEHADRIYSYFRVGGISTSRYLLSMTEVEIILEQYRNKIRPEIKFSKNNRYDFKQNSDVCNKGEGWSFSESRGTWALGNESLFYAHLKKTNYTMVVKIPIHLDYHRRLYLNGKFISDIEVKDGVFEAQLNKEFVKDGLNTFSFETTGEVRYSDEISDNPDHRRLNMFVEEISLMKQYNRVLRG